MKNRYDRKSNTHIPYKYSISNQMSNYHNKFISKQRQAVKEILALLFVFLVIMISLLLFFNHKKASYIIDGGGRIPFESESTTLNAYPIYPAQD